MKCVNFRTENITAEEYHAHPAISHGAVKCFTKESSWDFYHKYILRTVPDKETPAKTLGSAFHLAMEDPQAWRDSFVEYPVFVTINGSREPVNRRKPSHRQALEEWETEQRLKGKRILQPGDVDSIYHMTLSVMENPAAIELLQEDGAQEVPGLAFTSENSLEVKALADLWLPSWNSGDGLFPTIVDFKTTDCCSPEEWARKAKFTYGYHFQAAWYMDVFSADKFLFVVVRKEPPYECWVRECNEEDVLEGRAINDESLSRINEHMISGNWHTNGFGAVYPMFDRGVR